ncbi:AAA family ATPase [Kitasatospora sp. NPDC048239]|uniref:helix-turn-helix transcriptional regulator n=1 Tax=Kitasatospora sp. NPDC048239 TaxID=3364046 RepID=UPI0037123856
MLVGREQQLEELGQLLAATATHGPRLVTISGPAQSGKTALAQAFADRAAAMGATLRYVSAESAGRTTPFASLRRLFESDSISGGAVIGRLFRSALVDFFRALPGPVVLVLDDAHNADTATLRSLFALLRQARDIRLVLVLVGRGDLRSTAPKLQMSPPHELVNCRFRLEALPETAVRELLGLRFGTGIAGRLSSGVHALSGGQPRLVQGLVDDIASGPSAASADQVASSGYREAVLHLLEQCGPNAIRVARALAVLGQWGIPDRLVELLQLDVNAVIGSIRRLNHVGVLASGRFRHPTARSAVLDSMAKEELAALHAAAAALLYKEDAPLAAIAEHLLAAQWAESDWAVATLHDLAERAVGEGDPESALECLQLVLRSASGDRQRAATIAILARVEWRTDPALAARRMPELADLVVAGRLDDGRTLDLVSLLLSFGYDRVVADALARLDRRAATLPADRREQLRAAQLRLALSYPGTVGGAQPGWTPEVLDGAPEPNTTAGRTVALLTRLRYGRRLRDLTADAEQLLAMSTLLDEQTMASTVAALTTLTATGRLSTAEFWADVFISEAVTSRMTSWQSLFTAVKADLALRRGDLRRARADAQASIELACDTAREVWIGLPLAVLAQADTIAGRLDRAAEHLRVPVSGSMFRTPIGLSYLRARGRYLHETGRYLAAIDEFETIGRLMRDWQLDFPALVPWRTDAAQTLLAVGHTAAARKLAEEQLDLADGLDTAARGSALRLLAACAEPAQRAELLGDAVEILQGAGDQLELAHAVADFSRIHSELGHVGQARMMRRRAEYLVAQAGADRSLYALFPSALPSAEGDRPATDEQPVELSRAERRVAALAARGCTNREIAERLSITASTVEQHLTRVYRKLNVRSRAHLPVSLDTAG